MVLFRNTTGSPSQGSMRMIFAINLWFFKMVVEICHYTPAITSNSYPKGTYEPGFCLFRMEFELAVIHSGNKKACSNPDTKENLFRFWLFLCQRDCFGKEGHYTEWSGFGCTFGPEKHSDPWSCFGIRCPSIGIWGELGTLQSNKDGGLVEKTHSHHVELYFNHKQVSW
jgi:hypothetical protein